MNHPPNAWLMLVVRGKILCGRVQQPFPRAVCDKILRPYFAQRYDLSLEDSLVLEIINIG